MTTHFISAEIDLQDTPLKVQSFVESQLAKQGEPLRWSITQVDEQKGTMTIEAIILEQEIQSVEQR
jgi:hypothetical protein